MKSICKYCTFCKPLTETSAVCCLRLFKHLAIKPTKSTCKWYRPRTLLEADSRLLVIGYVRYNTGRQSYAPSECDMFIRGHIQDPGVQAAIPILIQDIEWYIDMEETETIEHRDIYLQLWKDLLQFIKENKKGDAR